MEGIGTFFKEDNGNFSSMRLLVAFIIVVQMLGWVSVVLRTGTLPPLDWQQSLPVVGSLLAKAWQKGKEDAAS